MIEISADAGLLLFPWKPLNRSLELIKHSLSYVVFEDGLRAMLSNQQSVVGKFKVVTAGLRDPLTSKPEASPTRRLYEEFEKLGVRASTRHFGGRMCLEVRFDVSSESSNACYELWTTIEDKDGLGEWVYAMVYLEMPDPVVMRNIHLLDGALFVLLEKCGFARARWN